MIHIGFHVGHLRVEEATSQHKNGYTIWRCRCDCGGEILLDTRTLQRGTITDCGCNTNVKPGQRDITGQRFGLLTAQYPLPARDASGSTVWHCRCDCGGEIGSTECWSGQQQMFLSCKECIEECDSGEIDLNNYWCNGDLKCLFGGR